MFKFSLCSLALLIVLPAVHLSSPAAAKAKPNKVIHRRADMNNAERAKLMLKAQQICKANYGPASTVYQLDYYKWRVVCTEH